MPVMFALNIMSDSFNNCWNIFLGQIDIHCSITGTSCQKINKNITANHFSEFLYQTMLTLRKIAM